MSEKVFQTMCIGCIVLALAAVVFIVIPECIKSDKWNLNGEGDFKRVHRVYKTDLITVQRVAMPHDDLGDAMVWKFATSRNPKNLFVGHDGEPVPGYNYHPDIVCPININQGSKPTLTMWNDEWNRISGIEIVVPDPDKVRNIPLNGSIIFEKR